MNKRTLPHSLDAEKSVLGAVLIAESAWPVAASCVAEADFFRDAHRQIFAAMHRLVLRGVTPDFITLKEELARAGQLEECGGPAYLSSLSDGVPRSTNVEYYAAIVREKARLRSVIWQADRLMTEAYEERQPAAALIDAAVRDLSGAIRAELGGTVTAAEAVHAYASALCAGTAGDPVTTGYADVDALVGGFRAPDLILVAARPSMGKTSWALGAADHGASAGKIVAFFTLEMGVSGIAERLLAWRSGVPSTAAVRGTATAEQYACVSNALGEFEDIPLLFQPTAATLAEIGGWCRRIQQERGLDAVVVDYLQLMIPETRQSSQEAEIAGISRGLKRLAKDLQVPVVALSQLNRAPEGRSDKRPHTADLRGSGALEQDADIVILLHRPETYKPTEENAGICEVIIAKHRNGPTGVVRQYFDRNLARFGNLVRGGGASSAEA